MCTAASMTLVGAMRRDNGADSDWGDPDLSVLGTGRRTAPVFPVDLLGNEWATWVERSAAVASAPVDYVGTSLLACGGAMLANVRWPVAGAAWSEPPVLWGANVGPPSASKSPAMTAVTDLVCHAEKRLAEGFDEDFRIYEAAKETAKATREAWEAEVKAAVKAGEASPPLPAAAAMPDEPVRPRVRGRQRHDREAGVLGRRLAARAPAGPRRDRRLVGILRQVRRRGRRSRLRRRELRRPLLHRRPREERQARGDSAPQHRCSWRRSTRQAARPDRRTGRRTDRRGSCGHGRTPHRIHPGADGARRRRRPRRLCPVGRLAHGQR